jgi:hypothetical protein
LTRRENEIYTKSKSTEVKSEILKALCPKGVTPEMCHELMEATVDVCSCFQVKFLVTAETIQWDHQKGTMLSDISSQLRWRKNSQLRHTQWQTNNKNTLGRIKTLKELLRGAKEVATHI